MIDSYEYALDAQGNTIGEPEPVDWTQDEEWFDEGQDMSAAAIARRLLRDKGDNVVQVIIVENGQVIGAAAR